MNTFIVLIKVIYCGNAYGINEDGAALHVITDAAQEAGAALSVIAC